MILGDKDRAEGSNGTTLDDLFRRAGVRHADAVALSDLSDGKPRQLTYAQADRAISALAARLRRMGLQTDTVVAMQLPNGVESVVALLGVLRAGMIAVPLPLLWRKQEMVAALKRIGAKAIIGSAATADVAMQAAAELFPIRYVCGFGRDLPDGIVPLDEIFAASSLEFVPPPVRVGYGAAQVAVVTFDVGAEGLCPVARNHRELIAGGLGPFLESGGGQDANILSAIPLGSFAGIAVTLMPWLLCGGTLSLHHGFDPTTFATQCCKQKTLVLPGPVLAALAEADGLGAPTNIIALWRSPERLATTAPWQDAATLTDVASFGETGLIATRRGSNGMPAALPFGIVGAPQGAASAIPVIETMRSVAGMLAVRGPMVPAQGFPPGAELGPEPFFQAHASGFVDTGFACRLERDSETLILSAPPAGMTSIGGYRFRQSAVDAEVAGVNPDATIVALPDAFLGARLAGSAIDIEAMAGELQTRGVNPLIAGAFRARTKAA